jgi:cytochrome c nitrite reductase small subunit
MRGNARLGAAALAVTLGLAVGTGGFTLVYGQGGSYLTSDPAACANCHVMQGYLDAWLQSSHRNVAVCNDCHAPHDLVGKYWTKARNGWSHSVAFTTGNFPEHLQIKDYNLAVTEAACRDCHEEVSLAVDGQAGGEPRSCVTCHEDVGHRNGAPIIDSGARGAGHTRNEP